MLKNIYLQRHTLFIMISPVFSFTDVCVLTNLEDSRRAYISVLPASLRPVKSILFPVDLLLCHMANKTEQRNKIRNYKQYSNAYI